MKVGILTYHRAVNAGAVLQAYALQETLVEMGYEAFVVDYNLQCIENAYKPLRKLDIRHPRGFLYELITSFVRKKRFNKFQEFNRQNLRVTELSNLSYMDFAILGSDQIWNSSICGGRLDPMFFNADKRYFAKQGIAYAASTMSVEKLTPQDLDDFAEWLPKLKGIGVRESKLGRFIKNKFSIDVTDVLDPTLIASKTIFQKFIGDRPIVEKYLLFYEVWHNDLVERKAREIATQKNLQFVSISGSDIRKAKADVIQVFSPEDFVNYIYHADHVVTSSFHGTAFSLIFEKSFNVVCEEPHQAVRLKELLKIVGCDNLLTFKMESVDDTAPDYSSVNEKLSKLKNQSRQFLLNNIR